MNKNIQKIDKGKFKVSTPGAVGQDLELDFSSVINEFDLTGDFALIHWQARPKGHRQWGVYSSVDDSYRSVEKVSINFAIATSLQLDDATAKTVPSAVILVQDSKTTCINNKAVIGEVLLSDFS